MLMSGDKYDGGNAVAEALTMSEEQAIMTTEALFVAQLDAEAVGGGKGGAKGKKSVKAVKKTAVGKKSKTPTSRNFSKPARIACWNNAEKIAGLDPKKWRKDVAGNIVHFDMHGV